MLEWLDHYAPLFFLVILPTALIMGIAYAAVNSK